MLTEEIPHPAGVAASVIQVSELLERTGQVCWADEARRGIVGLLLKMHTEQSLSEKKGDRGIQSAS